MPRYWKRNGRRELRIIIRNDCYRIDDKYLYLPKGLKLRYWGRLKWRGRQGRLEIIYDEVDGVWRGFIPVRVEEPPKCGGGKPLYIDREWVKRPIVFSGRTLLSDWWYWTRRIAREQGRLARVNRARTSKRLRRLYRIRRRRFRHAVNAMIKMIVEYAYHSNISKIVVGDLRGVRNNHGSSKVNSMVVNFWSYKWMIRRLKEKAEEYGIEVIEISEYRTSSICSRCGSDRVIKRKRLFKCLNCGLEGNRDAVDVLNIGPAPGGKTHCGALTGWWHSPCL